MALTLVLQTLSINSMVMFIIWLALAAFAVWLTFFIIGMFNPPPQLRILLTVLVAIVVVFFLLKQLGVI